MIGILDSGLGGLCALRALLERMPFESYLYLADTAHMPYGEKSKHELVPLSARGVSALSARGADRVLLACGTASSVASDFCKRYFTFPIHNVLEASVLAAVRATKSHRIGIAATAATIESGVLQRLIWRYDPSAILFPIGAPSLVQTVESQSERHAAYAAVKQALLPLQEAKVDTLLLGCTHFGWLFNEIGALLPSLTLIDSGRTAAEELYEELYGRIPPAPTRRASTVRFFTTGDAQAFSRRASVLLGRSVRAERISL